MCIILSGRAPFCGCTLLHSDKSLFRMCDIALGNSRTPCEVVSSPPPQKSPVDPACPRCSRAGHIIIFISPLGKRKTSSGMRDVYGVVDAHAELQAQLTAAMESSLPSCHPIASLHDQLSTMPLGWPAASVEDEAMTGTTSFEKVEHKDAEEQLDCEGAPPASLDGEDDIDKFLACHSPMVTLGKGFGVALGRLLSSHKGRRQF